MTDQCLFIIKLIILELYVCNGDIEKLPTQHLENFENKKLQWERKWKGNTLVWWNVGTSKSHKWPCFKKYFEETPKYDKWCTHTWYL